MQTVTALRQAGTTIIMVTHNPDLAVRADRQLCILDGVLREAG